LLLDLLLADARDELEQLGIGPGKRITTKSTSCVTFGMVTE